MAEQGDEATGAGPSCSGCVGMGGRGWEEGDGGGGGVTGTQILNHRQEAESEPGMKRGSETLKPSPNAILPSSRPQLLDLSK